MERFVLYVNVHVDLILDVDLVLDVNLAVDFDVDSKDISHFSPQDMVGRWSKPRGAMSLDCGLCFWDNTHHITLPLLLAVLVQL